jgi:phosphatidylglycerophosphatase A
MHDRFIKLLATGFGAGWSPVGPGTVGSALGVLYAVGLARCVASAWLYATVSVLMILLAVRVTERAAALMGEKDPGCVVLDEIVAVPVAMAGLDTGWWTVAVAFIWFRLFDVWKPGLVGRVQSLPGGWGIVMDDVLAGVLACLASHLTLGAWRWGA